MIQRKHIKVAVIVLGVGLVILAGAFLWANFQHGNFDGSNDQLANAEKKANSEIVSLEKSKEEVKIQASDILEIQTSKEKLQGETKIQDKKISYEDVRATLPKCTNDNVFTFAPISQGHIDWIIPLGSVGTHFLPTDHLYVVPKRDGSVVPVIAPGDIMIYSIFNSKVRDENDKFVSDDYAVDFFPCREVEARFGHVKSLSTDLNKVLLSADKQCDPDYKAGKWMASSCRYSLEYRVKAGQVIGYIETKDNSPVFDFGMYDRRNAPLNFINPQRHLENELYAACPLDFYLLEIKSSLYSFLGRSNSRRTIEPICGTIMQDLPGTVQGDWFGDQNSDQNLINNGRGLALIHDSGDPALGVVSIGQAFAINGRAIFNPKHDGFINREFSEIKADGKVYCYQNEEKDAYQALKGKVLLEFLGDATLKIEIQTGGCDVVFNFNEPSIYYR